MRKIFFAMLIYFLFSLILSFSPMQKCIFKMFIENVSHVIEIISKFVQVNCILSLRKKKILELEEKNISQI